VYNRDALSVMTTWRVVRHAYELLFVINKITNSWTETRYLCI